MKSLLSRISKATIQAAAAHDPATVCVLLQAAALVKLRFSIRRRR